jgi:hypothetical protein
MIYDTQMLLGRHEVLQCPWDNNLSTKTHKQDPMQIWRETTYYVHGIYNL